jgi:outer membrane protein OmpA-like peptidoglycan-associated protein
MSDGPERIPPRTDGVSTSDDERAAEFARLRALLFKREQDAIAELRERLDAMGLTSDELAEHLPEAVALRSGRDEQLARALEPTLEQAFSKSVHRHPQQIAQAIYPALGPAIRKAIAEAIAGLVGNINRALDESLSLRGLKWRWEAWRSGVPYPQVVMKHALVYRVEQVYLIHAETGLLLAHVTAPDLAAPDADVISGMLTAIRDFVGDAFEPKADGGLRTFSVGDVTVLVEAGPRAMLAAAVRGQHPPELIQRLQETLELLHFQFADPLLRFDGDAAAFEPATPILAECLETVVDTKRARRRSVVPRVAWGSAAVLLLLLIAVLVVRGRQWHRAVQALAAEPGIVVLESERGWRTGRITGLRDPLARDPAAVLAGAGIDTGRVTRTFAPYLSADPALVLVRASRALAPTASVDLRLAGDTLIAAGTASADWILSARARAAGIPGLGAYRDADVVPEVPAALRPMADSLAARRILFAVGSADLPAEAERILRDVAARWRTMQQAVGSSWLVALELVGRTDSTGSREFNRALGDQRADQVARALVRQGLPMEVLQARGIGTQDPLPAPNAEERARRNRSVSFSVRLEPAEPVQETQG